MQAHASCVAVGEAGILVRGASGAGKSRLAYGLVSEAPALGLFARLVADDRVALAASAGRIVARALPATAGLLELRGIGLVRLPYLAAVRLSLVIDLVDDDPPRLPDPEAGRAEICGIVLPRLVSRFDNGIARIILGRLGGVHDTAMTEL